MLQERLKNETKFGAILGMLCVPHGIHLMAKAIGSSHAVSAILDALREIIKTCQSKGPVAAILKFLTGKGTQSA